MGVPLFLLFSLYERLLMKSPSVLLVITDTGGGGAELIVRKIAALGSKDFRYKVLYLKNSARRELEDNEICLNIGWLWNPLSMIRVLLWVRRYSYLGYTIIHAHLTHPLYLCALAPVKNGTKKLFTEHNTWNRRRLIPLLKFVERPIYRQYHQIACISQAVKSSLSEWLGPALATKLQVVENGARTFAFRPRSRYQFGSNHGLSGIVVGSLTPQKNHAFALELVARSGESIEKLYFVGDGPLKSRLQRQSRDLGVTEKISFEGFQEDIEAYLYRADFALVPSLWEGFGLVIIEQVSSGLPTLVSNVDGAAQLVEDMAISKALALDDLDAWVREIEGLRAADSRLLVELQSDSVSASKMDVNKMIHDYEKWYVS